MSLLSTILLLGLWTSPGALAAATDPVPTETIEVEPDLSQIDELPRSQVDLIPEHRTLTWSPPGLPGSSPPEPMVTYRLGLPAGYSLLASKNENISVKELEKTDTRTTYEVEVHIPSIATASHSLRLVSSEGKVKRLPIGLKFKIKAHHVSSNPACEEAQLFLEEEKGNTDKTAFFLTCSPLANSQTSVRVTPLRLIPTQERVPTPITWSVKIPPPTPEAGRTTFSLPNADGGEQKYTLHYGRTRTDPKHWYGYAQVGAVAGLQTGGGGSSFTLEGAWRPTQYLSDTWAARGLVGFALNKGATSLVPTFDFILTGAFYGTDPWIFEAGAGLEMYFTSPSGSFPIAYVQATRKMLLPVSFLKWVDRIHFSYGMVLNPDFPTHEFRVGLGTSF